jgi:hypothetical protein|tara:strand:+ start:152 stop:553 length:402 start_codon:yes stop_codon:yes gene_type:complete
MKDIKSYVIGFLTCACMFLIMGQTNGEEQTNEKLKSKVDWLEKELKNHKKDLVDLRKLVTDKISPLASAEAELKTMEKLGNSNYGKFAPVGYIKETSGDTYVHIIDTQTGQLYSNKFNKGFGKWNRSGKKIKL